MNFAGQQFQTPVALAPMAGITDRPFRDICRQWGASWAVAEMLSADTTLWHTRKSQLRMAQDDEDGLRIVQIAGSDPQMLANAARLNVERGAQVVDINMGCPAKKVCKRAAGSALLGDETLVAEILDAVVGAVDVPVTLKFRTGITPEQNNALTIAQMAEKAGIRMLALHGRSRADAYRGQAEHGTVRSLKSTISIPILANGDITTARDAAGVLQQTGVDGLLIGRGAQGRPWLFRQIRSLLDRGVHETDPDFKTQRDSILTHISAIHAYYGPEHGVRMARKHIGWYLEQWPSGESLRQDLMRCTVAADQFDRLAQGLEQRIWQHAA